MNKQTITWEKIASLPEGYYSGEAVSLNNEIYFVTRRNDISRTAFFYKFNPKENQWIKLDDVPDPAINLALAAINGKILEPMPTGRQHISSGLLRNNAAVVSLDSLIYVIGGTVGGNPDWDTYREVYEGEYISDENRSKTDLFKNIPIKMCYE